MPVSTATAASSIRNCRAVMAMRDAVAQERPEDTAWPAAGTAGASAFGVREKQLVGADLVIGDDLLAFRRNDPVDEGLPHVLLHMGVFRRVDQHDAVLVE